MAPFIAPNRALIRSIRSTPASTGPPRPSLDISFDPKTLVRAIMEVTDRSIPPVIITSVMPIATTSSGNM